MTMRLQADTLREEIDQVLALLTRQQAKLAGGIPGDEMPSNDMNVEVFQYQLRGEIMLAAERLVALAEVLES
jgi:hypothetical protein